MTTKYHGPIRATVNEQKKTVKLSVKRIGPPAGKILPGELAALARWVMAKYSGYTVDKSELDIFLTA